MILTNNLLKSAQSAYKNNSSIEYAESLIANQCSQICAKKQRFYPHDSFTKKFIDPSLKFHYLISHADGKLGSTGA